MKTLIEACKDFLGIIFCDFAIIAIVTIGITPLILLAVFESYLFIFLYIPMFVLILWIEKKENKLFIKNSI